MENTNKDLQDLRQNYQRGVLLKAQVKSNPYQQFEQWFNELKQSNIREPNAMILATCNAQNQPAARTVLLKGFSDAGFIWYTNYQSRKAQDLAANPKAALLFYWDELERQVRIEGQVSKVTSLVSDNYFSKRPKGSQIGAWASPQSKVIASRKVLENKVLNLRTIYKEEEQILRPPHWGGYCLKADQFEFWQGRSSRLHDRIRYQLKTTQGTSEWLIERLAP